jgi:hypothetical protein
MLRLNLTIEGDFVKSTASCEGMAEERVGRSDAGVAANSSRSFS